MDMLQEFDWAVLGRIAALHASSLGPMIERALMVPLELDLLKAGPLVLALLAVWLAPAGTPGRPILASAERSVHGGLGLMAALAAGRILQTGLPMRERPRFVRPEDFVVLDSSRVLHDWSSMPSDHAVMVGALAATIWAGSRRLGLAAAAWGAAFVCLPRLVFGLHFLSDLAVGAVIGAAIVILVRQLPLPAAGWTWLRRLDARAPSLLVLGLFVFGWELIGMFETTRRLLHITALLVS